ncbi:hypothetical protein SDC9_152837 [bioreactor metagenome]|uniref:Uncharacterized protein n=1 Tax=bioreactor metagenome TaxID=1076179 RepID=A0A645EVY0_9ZZZZ
MFNLVKERVKGDFISEIYADRFINTACSFVFVFHQLLYHLELFSRRKRSVKLYPRGGRKLYHGVLRKIFNSAAVIAGPFVCHRVFVEIDRYERELVEPSCDIAVFIDISAGLACTHGDSKDTVVVEIHRTGKRSYIAVIRNLYRNIVAQLFGNIEINVLYIFIKILVRNLYEQRSDHYTVVNTYAGGRNAYAIHTRHMLRGGLH